ncbi:MAG: hypothetical protein ACLPX5_08035 [Dissulfurispiraceae bacterium]
MTDINYKEYSPEEGKIYNASIAKIRGALTNDLSFKEACSMVEVKDAELKKLIIDDALKIMIAEMHYNKGLLLSQISEILKVPLKTIEIAKKEMMEDVEVTATEVYRRTNPDSPIGNA